MEGDFLEKKDAFLSNTWSACLLWGLPVGLCITPPTTTTGGQPLQMEAGNSQKQPILSLTFLKEYTLSEIGHGWQYSGIITDGRQITSRCFLQKIAFTCMR